MSKFVLPCARSIVLVAASLFGLGITSAAAVDLRVAQPPVIQELRFFTIADRLKALRQHGAIRPSRPDQGTGVEEVEPATQRVDEPPTMRDLGLRLDVGGPDTPGSAILGATSFPVPGGELAAKWQAMIARWRREETQIAACAEGNCKHRGAAKWNEIRRSAEKLDGEQRLAHVNAALNRSIFYNSDFRVFGVPDYWASPLEVIERAGDCEDYAIAKFLMLKALGTDERRMKIVALYELISGEFHAVLAVWDGREWVFLDNKRTGVARERDYAETRALATVDTDGQSMLIRVMPEVAALRLSTL